MACPAVRQGRLSILKCGDYPPRTGGTMNNKSFVLLLIDKFVLLLISGWCLYYAIHIALPPPVILPNGTIVPHVATSNETTLLGSLIAFLAGAQGFLWSSLRSELKEVFGGSASLPSISVPSGQSSAVTAQSAPITIPASGPINVPQEPQA